MDFVKNTNWSLIYGCGCYLTFTVTFITNGISALFIRPRPNFLSTLHDLSQITSMNSLFWPLYALIVFKRLIYAVYHLDHKYITPLIRLNPELNYEQYKLTQKHLSVASNLFSHRKVNNSTYYRYVIMLPLGNGIGFGFEAEY